MPVISPLRILLTIIALSVALIPGSSRAFDLPDNFENLQILDRLNEPDHFVFSPDGRLFISERITGRLLVAKYDRTRATWSLNAEPFHTFDVPKNSQDQPEARRSAGLRGVAFDPNFDENGFVYAFYMKDDALQNRVVRLKAAANPDLADPAFGEELLIDLPFNATLASGSHNGGALEFDDDGKLFITTGDGWTGDFEGDPVQSLSSFTGKVLRINADGTIPMDNPFYGQTSGSYRAIYALGLRNPYSMSKNRASGKLYINEARGNNKASIYLLEAGANYGHEAAANVTIGTPTSPWADASGAGGELITGGAWYPTDGPFPERYHGAYFVALWGSNSDSRGQISLIQSESDTSVTHFEGDVGISTEPPVKPVITRIGPDGNLYYMLTTYQTGSGTIQMIRYTGRQTVATPRFEPDGGRFEEPVEVVITTETVNATIRYTLDNSEPTQTSLVYGEPISVTVSSTLKAKAFAEGMNASSTGSASFQIGAAVANQPPIVSAGPDQRAVVGAVVALDGSASTDPDGDDELLRAEQWTQLSGPAATILDAGEELAYFTPAAPGIYVFELSMSDGENTGTDRVTVGVRATDSCVLRGLQSLYLFSEGTGDIVRDRAGGEEPLHLTILGEGAVWLSGGGLAVTEPTSIVSSTPATRLIEASQAGAEFSVELWIKPANVSQDGPARIFTISASPLARNFTVGQGKFGDHPADVFDFRLRTSSTQTDNNGEPSTTTEAGVATTGLTHLVYAHDARGLVSVSVGGSSVMTKTVDGDLSNWNANYKLGLGNEFGGGRPWLGEFYRVAYYSCALSRSDVTVNFELGPQVDALPEAQPAPTSTPMPTSTPLPTPIEEEDVQDFNYWIYLPQLRAE